MQIRAFLARRSSQAVAGGAQEARGGGAQARRRRSAAEGGGRQARGGGGARAAEAEKKAKEAEEKDRQERFRRARQLSFERKTAKKREEAEKKKAEEEAGGGGEAAALAATGAVNRAASFGEAPLERKSRATWAGGNARRCEKLQTSSRTWPTARRPTRDDERGGRLGHRVEDGAGADEEDVWAQYDFKCAVSDVLEYAEYLGMDIKEDAHLLWIADEALQAPEPQGWEQRLDPKGGVYYYHPTTGMSLNQHPLDHHYQQFYMQMKAQYDAMYQNEDGRGRRAETSADAATRPPPARRPRAASRRLTTSARAAGKPKRRGLFSCCSKKTGPVEEMFQPPSTCCYSGRPGHRPDARQHHRGGRAGRRVPRRATCVRRPDRAGGRRAARRPHAEGRIVPRKMHQLVVRYSRVSSQPLSPRGRGQAHRGRPNSVPRRIEEIDLRSRARAARGGSASASTR